MADITIAPGVEGEQLQPYNPVAAPMPLVNKPPAIAPTQSGYLTEGGLVLDPSAVGLKTSPRLKSMASGLSDVPPQAAPATAPVQAAPVQPQQAQPAAPAMATQTETTTQIAPKLTPEQKAQEQRAFEATVKAAEAKANLESMQAADLAVTTQAKAEALMQERQQAQAEAAAVKKDTDARTNEWLSALDDYKAAQKKGPEQLSTGQSILAAIANGLGAFASGINGGPNQAMQIVNRAADERVRKWERELDAARGKVDIAKNAVAFFRQKGMDQQAASNAARLAIIDDAMIQGDKIAAGYKNQQIQATWAETKAGLEQRRIQLLNAQSLDEQNKSVVKRLSGPAAAPSVADQIKMRELEVEVTQGAGRIDKFYAKSGQEAQKIRDAQKVISGVSTDLLSMEALLRGHPTLNPQTSQKVSILNDAIRKKYIKLDELGVPTGKDLELSSVIGDPTRWTQTSNQTRELINRVRQDAAQRLLSAYEVQGYRGGAE